jgi:hypothetical protein
MHGVGTLEWINNELKNRMLIAYLEPLVYKIYLFISIGYMQNVREIQRDNKYKVCIFLKMSSF